MFDYIIGKIVSLTPTYLVLDNQGVGYMIHISLNTFSALKPDMVKKIFVYQYIKEDAHLLYGFENEHEREVFKVLLSVSGIGANTARMILSALTPSEVVQAIATENIKILQGIKGIGSKTAQRMIVELKDKVTKILPVGEQNITLPDNTLFDEALSALVMLGFAKPQVDKVLKDIMRQYPANMTVEEVIKMALKVL